MLKDKDDMIKKKKRTNRMCNVSKEDNMRYDEIIQWDRIKITWWETTWWKKNLKCTLKGKGDEEMR